MNSKRITPKQSIAWSWILGPGLAMAAVIALAQQQDGPIGKVSQPLVAGTLVSADIQRQFGLLTLSTPSGTCSASMLNQYWAITAAHCVYQSVTGPSAIFAANQITLTSIWPGDSKSVKARQVVAFNKYPFSQGSDIALLQTGRNDFYRLEAKDRTIARPGVLNNLTLQVFGRGIFQLAFQQGPTAVPSKGDGQYRAGNFTTGGIMSSALDTPPVNINLNSQGGVQVAGGDSGGPSYFQAWDDASSPRRKLEWRLLGVHHECQAKCLTGQNCSGNGWTWVSQIPSCSDASVLPVWQQITQTIQAQPADDSPTGSFSTAVPPAVLQHKRALYAMSIDEPLVAPAGAAIDVQLTFKQCHGLLVVGASGCPVDASLELWGYDLATHRLLHLPSGKCLNISGARREAGALIILYPCSGVANEKWTVIPINGTSMWTVKSDLSAKCLAAVSQNQPSTGTGLSKTLAIQRPALLTQMSCDGSKSQIFAPTDAGWAARNGPR